MPRSTVVAAVFLLMMLALPAASPRAAAMLFDTARPLDLTLLGPFARIDRERDRDAVYRGSVSWQGAAGPRTLDVKYEARGHFRLQRRICDHVPLWLDFDKDEVAGTPFAGQNRLKLVLQCRDGDRYAGYLAREEQVYRMFALLSPVSLKTRLLEITYRDSDTGEERRQPAFLLQHHKRLAADLDYGLLEVERLRRSRLDPAHSSLVALFMFMVANTDFSMAVGRTGDDCCHNTKPLADAAGRVFALPYDFDSTGYVDASYAEPSAAVRQRGVRDRVYRGYCAHNSTLPDALQRLRAARPRLLAIAGEERWTSRREARRATRFLEKFFDIIDSDTRTRWEITSACLG